MVHKISKNNLRHVRRQSTLLLQSWEHFVSPHQRTVAFAVDAAPIPFPASIKRKKSQYIEDVQDLEAQVLSGTRPRPSGKPEKLLTWAEVQVNKISLLQAQRCFQYAGMSKLINERLTNSGWLVGWLVQWQILIRRSRKAEGYRMQSLAPPSHLQGN
jgi:hypothetical protein